MDFWVPWDVVLVRPIYLLIPDWSIRGYPATAVTQVGRRKEESDPEDGAKKEEQDSGEEELDDDLSNEVGSLSKFNHQLEATLRQPHRNLAVKDLLLTFQDASIYGKRSAWARGLLITATHLNFGPDLKLHQLFGKPQCKILVETTLQIRLIICLYHERINLEAKDSGNLFHKSPAWRRGIVGEIQMLQRNEMYRLSRQSDTLRMNSSFTLSQEARQACFSKIFRFLNTHFSVLHKMLDFAKVSLPKVLYMGQILHLYYIVL